MVRITPVYAGNTREHITIELHAGRNLIDSRGGISSGIGWEFEYRVDWRKVISP
jgi:hypothetical protein